MRPENRLVVLFADICGSTQLYSQQGDVSAFERVDGVMKRLAHLTVEHGGRVIKTMGDGVMCTFADCDAAFRAAAAMQEPTADADLPVKIGFHRGPVILEADDVFGDTVNVAARILGLSGAGEILMSEQAVAGLSDTCRARTRLIDEVEVKGKSRPIPIHEIVREDEEMTTLVSRSARPATPRIGLVLSIGNERYVVGPERPSIVIGRTDGCEIVIRDTDVSRRHASVELRLGAFYLSDHSTNGTFLIPQDGATQHVRRQSVPLPSCGGISPGVSPATDTRTLIEFWRDEN